MAKAKTAAATAARREWHWTRAIETRFLTTLRETGNVTKSCQRIGFPVYTYTNRARDDQVFRVACEAAKRNLPVSGGADPNEPRPLDDAAPSQEPAAIELPLHHASHGPPPPAARGEDLRDADLDAVAERVAAIVTAQPDPTSPKARDALLARLAVLRARLHEAEFLELKRRSNGE